ncbi:hypothetical protein K2173_001353 [Erythroxylum novogranatense]|uniref:Plastid movement impaired 2 n=1 Tax=Erythroxylum novogranatense TaxID=1862640 RepID=A0AAV8T3P7_9ROSI|nr:hypothetical protein K2173_001353 [Erythroxylum novogranatense]
MGNSIGGGKRPKVMKINGETFKVKTPARVLDVVKDYPGYVLLDSDAVKHFGIRAKPLEPEQELKRKKIYFLVELPKFPEANEPRTRRVRSGIHMSAKDRLECLMLSRRTVSDLSAIRPPPGPTVDSGPNGQNATGPMRVKIRLPRGQVMKFVEESKDDGEVAEKIIDLFMESSDHVAGGGQWKPEIGGIAENCKPHKKRVSFVPDDGEIHLVADSRYQSRSDK